MNDLISKQAIIDRINKRQRKLIYCFGFENDMVKTMDIAKSIITAMPSAQPDIIRCKDCIYGYLYIDIQNGVTDSWIECRNPEGLNRDVSVDGYCSASIRRSDE